MNIHIDMNTLFFEKHTASEKIKRLKIVKKTIKNLLNQPIQSFYPENKLINELHIIKYDDSLGFYGKVNPIIVNNTLKFNIIYTDIVITWFYNKNSNKYIYAKSIIYHELYHLKEMCYTSKNVPQSILFLDENMSTHDVILCFALHQWSEYYAYRYSSKINTESFNLKNNIIDAYANLSVCSDHAKDNTTVSIPPEMEEKISKFISKCIREIAFYHETGDIKFIDQINQYKDSYPNEYNYFIFLEKLLLQKWSEYESKISKEWLLDFGKSLYYIYKLYHLDFSTDDLSDNFIFKYIP